MCRSYGRGGVPCCSLISGFTVYMNNFQSGLRSGMVSHNSPSISSSLTVLWFDCVLGLLQTYVTTTAACHAATNQHNFVAFFLLHELKATPQKLWGDLGWHMCKKNRTGPICLLCGTVATNHSSDSIHHGLWQDGRLCELWFKNGKTDWPILKTRNRLL